MCARIDAAREARTLDAILSELHILELSYARWREQLALLRSRFRLPLKLVSLSCELKRSCQVAHRLRDELEHDALALGHVF